MAVVTMDILITEEVEGDAIERLSETYEVFRDAMLWEDEAKLKAAIHDARILVIRNQTRVTAPLLEAAEKLIGIGRIGVGLDNIDMPAVSERGVVVIAPLDANATSVAELTLGLILALARKIPAADRLTRTGHWNRREFTGMELAGKTLAICGFGRIGRKVAHLARAFGMQVVVHDPYVKPTSPLLHDTGVTLCHRLEDGLAEADFVTAHSPLTPETRHLFNTLTFATMKRGAFFINTSRGGVVDERALLEALRSGQLGGAALDVREIEPPGARAEFETMENVVLTPHIGSFTQEAQSRTVNAVASDVERLLRGTPAINFVNFPLPRR
ncbi:MAG: hydroxyacid dehydrogenase [Verrucomicrobiota bacterium]